MLSQSAGGEFAQCAAWYAEYPRYGLEDLHYRQAPEPAKGHIYPRHYHDEHGACVLAPERQELHSKLPHPGSRVA